MGSRASGASANCMSAGRAGPANGPVRAITTGSARPTASLVVGSSVWIEFTTLASGAATNSGPLRRPDADCSARAIPRNDWSLRRIAAWLYCSKSGSCRRISSSYSSRCRMRRFCPHTSGALATIEPWRLTCRSSQASSRPSRSISSSEQVSGRDRCSALNGAARPSTSRPRSPACAGRVGRGERPGSMQATATATKPRFFTANPPCERAQLRGHYPPKNRPAESVD